MLVKIARSVQAFASRPYDVARVESPPQRVVREIDAAIEFWRLPPPPGPIVEFGSGTGRLTRPLLQRGYVVNAIEPDSRTHDALEMLRRRFPDQLRYAADARDLPLAGDQAAAVGVDVLHHTEPVGLLRLAHGVVKDSGVIGFDEPDGGHLGWWIFVALTGRISNETGLVNVTAARLAKSFAEAGLSGLSLRRWAPGLRGRLSPRWFCSASK